MRFNKNFANVYTPYHDFEYITLSLEEKKNKRMAQRPLRLESAAIAPAPIGGLG